MSILDSTANRFKRFASPILRITLAITFILFAIQKLKYPGQGAAEIQLLFPFLEGNLPSLINFISSILELLIAISFITGIGTRLMGLLGSLFIGTIIVANFYWSGLNIGADMYRDIGLVGASFAIFLLGR